MSCACVNGACLLKHFGIWLIRKTTANAKHRLSISLKKKSNLDTAERFKQDKDEEMEVAVKGVLPQNTTRNNRWAANNFTEWIKDQQSSDVPIPKA